MFQGLGKTKLTDKGYLLPDTEILTLPSEGPSPACPWAENYIYKILNMGTIDDNKIIFNGIKIAEIQKHLFSLEHKIYNAHILVNNPENVQDYDVNNTANGLWVDNYYFGPRNAIGVTNNSLFIAVPTLIGGYFAVRTTKYEKLSMKEDFLVSDFEEKVRNLFY